jgi:hypothetical protein
MTLPDFAAYAAELQCQGYDEVVAREWAPDAVVDTHTHPFAAKALVVRGEMWLSVGERTQHLRVGEGFELDREVPHRERYGSEGATYWVGRRATT